MIKRILLISSIILTLSAISLNANDKTTSYIDDKVDIYPGWYYSGLYFPVFNIVAVELVPYKIDTTYNAQKWAIMKENKNLDVLLKDIKKERYKATIGSSVIGITLLAWWGLIWF